MGVQSFVFYAIMGCLCQLGCDFLIKYARKVDVKNCKKLS